MANNLISQRKASYCPLTALIMSHFLPIPAGHAWGDWPEKIKDNIEAGKVFAVIRNKIPRTLLKTLSDTKEDIHIWDSWLGFRRDRSKSKESYKDTDCLFLFPGGTKATIKSVTK